MFQVWLNGGALGWCHLTRYNIVTMLNLVVYNLQLVYHTKPSKTETPHSFKGQQLENKSLYRFVIYVFREIS